MKAATNFVLSLLAAVPLVAAHGYVSELTVDGKTYKGNTPNSNSVKSPIRMIDDVSPVKGATNKYLACGQNAQKAATVATAKPGSKVSFQWVNGNGGDWPHNVGPMLTYMASCGDAGCASFDAADAKWFKIEETGLQSDGTWAQAALTQGAPAEVQLPSDIASGEYLIRHEIIALHTAMSEGGAEFYPSCAQLKISGSGSGSPKSTVSLPGAYKDTDAGLLVDVYDLVGDYVFPGPAISNLAGKTINAIDGSGGSDDSDSTDDSSHSSSESASATGTASSTSTSTGSVSASASAVAPASPSATSSKSASATKTSSSASASASAADESECEEEDEEDADDEESEDAQYPRRWSRVMRAIL
ncbi:glycosyl hydrolase family 61-domain-containing protein [Trametes elegans]|nr:glycosyl hydrolase family 61-domain-containing protein [Trametes elegans]